MADQDDGAIDIYEASEEGELAVSAPPPALFGSPDDPEHTVEMMTRHAKALARIIEEQKLYTQIRGRRHIQVEGWTTLGAMVGVFPVTVWTRELPNGWEARVEARTLSGAVVGAAEAMCTHDEKPGSGGSVNQWKNADEFALRSMAQTRATSKALRMPLAFIVKMAGFDASPTEEMVVEAPVEIVRMGVNAVKVRTMEAVPDTVTNDQLIEWWEAEGQSEYEKRSLGNELITEAQANDIVELAKAGLTVEGASDDNEDGGT